MDFPAAIIAAYSVTLDVGWLVRRDDIIVMASSKIFRHYDRNSKAMLHEVISLAILYSPPLKSNLKFSLQLLVICDSMITLNIQSRKQGIKIKHTQPIVIINNNKATNNGRSF